MDKKEMKKKTSNKFNIGDKVWFMSSNVAREDIVKLIKVAGYNESIIEYGFGTGESVKESCIFPSKEELLKSL